MPVMGVLPGGTCTILPSERARKTILSKCNSYGAIRLPSRDIRARITYGNCYKTSSLLSKTSAGNWDLYVIAIGNTGNGIRPFPSKPGNGVGAWDLHIHYTVFPGDSKSRSINGDSQGLPLGGACTALSGRRGTAICPSLQFNPSSGCSYLSLYSQT